MSDRKQGWWEAWYERAQHALDPEDPQDALIIAQEMLIVALNLAGVACEACDGRGEKSYPSTAGASGGAGGMAITTGRCPRCLGFGRNDVGA